jgi:RNA polymerase sigma factor (sigma-70 family)
MMSTDEPGLDEKIGRAKPSAPGAPPCLGAPCREQIGRLARKLLRDPEDVEDLVQEVCTRCLLGQKRLSPASHFRTWRSRTIVSACKTLREWHRVSLLAAESPSSRDALDVAFRDAEAAPAGGDTDSVAENVRAALQQLHPRQRQLLVWRYLERASFAQIAERLGIVVASARPAVHRARSAFAAAYEMTARGSDEPLPLRLGWTRRHPAGGSFTARQER